MASAQPLNSNQNLGGDHFADQSSNAFAPNVLEDGFGRRFSYLRVSLTDACNFKCQYCLPNGYHSNSAQSFLSVSEVKNLIDAFAEMGTVKVRLTGGEPTLRKDLVDVVKVIRDNPQIETLALSTNGFSLKKLARPLFEAGLNQVNVSVDSLDQKLFALRTGRDLLPQIVDGIEESLKLGMKVKVNAVLMRDFFDRELNLFQEWVRTRPVAVRFIELMPTKDNGSLFSSQHLRGEAVKSRLTEDGWQMKAREANDGPAFEYVHPKYQGRLGIIAPYDSHFCSNCNRLRITSRGGLRLCLFGEGDLPIREYLQSSNDREDLKERVRLLLGKKEVSHYLPDGRVGDNWSFSAMGG